MDAAIRRGNISWRSMIFFEYSPSLLVLFPNLAVKILLFDISNNR